MPQTLPARVADEIIELHGGCSLVIASESCAARSPVSRAFASGQSSHERVLILLSLLGGARRVTLPAADIVAAL